MKFLFLLLIVVTPLFSQSIAEKKKGLSRGTTDLDPRTEETLLKVNDELEQKRTLLREAFFQAAALQKSGGTPEQFKALLKEIQLLRNEITRIQDEWQQVASASGKTDLYALWHQPDTTVEQVVIDYGSHDFIYVMPPEVGEMKLSINSNLPVPRAEWGNLLQIILTQNGVGIRELNPFLRELYTLTDHSTPVTLITNRREELEFIPLSTQIAYVLSPDPADVRRSWTFLQKFINPRSTRLEQLGREILIIATAGEVLELLKMYDFVAANKSQKEYKLVPLSRIKAEEMGKLIGTLFDQMEDQTVISAEEGAEKSFSKNTLQQDTNGLRVVVLESLSQAVFLVGTEREIEKAEEMIKRVESSIGGGSERIIEWYNVKHSVAQELADILQDVYTAMVQQRVKKAGTAQPEQQPQNLAITLQQQENPAIARTLFDNSYYLNNEAVINPAPIDPGAELNEPRTPGRKNPNFIVDEKSSAIIMVIEKELLPRLKEVIAKLDIPKKMVQIDVLLFERKTNQKTHYGLNLLKIGGAATNTRNTAFSFVDDTLFQGITTFLLSRPKSCNGFPAFDLMYKFLLTQDNLTINSNPSVVTINQTPAEISIREEISISTGVNFIDTTNQTTPKDSFARAQFGISIEVTPTIHLASEEDLMNNGIDYVTLETYVNFDTTDTSAANIRERPNVQRRSIKNEVLIPDGQTVILGGLRRKDSSDNKQSIPYLGEIPGIGKLFSMTELEDTTVEMFIFLTPKIIHEPCEDIERVKFEKFKERPGDLPSFLCRMNESRERQFNQAFSHTVKMVCGPTRTRYYPAQTGCVPAELLRNWGTCAGEYDGCE